jgi:hypothetical protein
MKKIIIVTTLLVSFAAQAAELGDWVVLEKSQPASSWTVAKKPTEAPKSDIAIGGQKDTTVDDWTVIETNKPKPEAPKKSAGLISSPAIAGITGSALDLTKNLLVGPSAKSDGGSKGSTWTGNIGVDIQNQGLDQTYVGPISTPVTTVGGGTTQIQFVGGGNTAAQQVNKPKKK